MVYQRVHQEWPNVRAYFNHLVAQRNKDATVSLWENLNKETIKRVQSNHLAAALFSLDEIVVPPRVLLPLITGNPDELTAIDDPIHEIVPYLPDWPELTGQLSIPSLSLVEVLQGHTNIAIIGQPGSGKTVALSWLASQIIRKKPEMGKLAEYSPIYLHVNDLDFPITKNADVSASIFSTIRNYLPGLASTQTFNLIKKEFESRPILLLLDGADELSPSKLKLLTNYLRELLRVLPNIRLVIAGSPEYLDGLLTLNLFPVTLTSWNQSQCIQFVVHWGALWTEFIEPTLVDQAKHQLIDPILLDNWLADETSFLSPLELTLKTWAAFAGDSFGSKFTDDLDSFLRRHISDARLLPALEEISLEMVDSLENSMPKDQLEKIITGKNTNLIDLTSIGLLTKGLNEKIAFIHPILMGYLAGQALNDSQRMSAVLKQPLWLGKILSLRFLAACVDISEQVNGLLDEDSRSLLYSNLFMVSRWLRDVPGNTSWRNLALRQLAEILKLTSFPFCMRARALAALLISKDPSVILLLRQLIIINHPSTRQLAILGCSALQDKKSSDDLAGMLIDSNLNIRSTAGVGLISISFNNIDLLKKVILQGDEVLGRMIAISLAASSQGQDTLQSWSTDANLLIRRFCVFGLAMIHEKWANDLLGKISVEESEWVVRNAASQALEIHQKGNPYIPTVPPDPHNLPWLIAFASTQGKGISPGKPATPTFVSVLENGSTEERKASLYYLSLIPEPEPETISAIYRLAFNGKEVLQDAAFNTLWMMAIRGVYLLSPLEYGIFIPGLHDVR